MAPMISDSYLKYSNPDFGANKSYSQSQGLQSQVGIAAQSYYSKVPPSTMHQQSASSESDSSNSNGTRPLNESSLNNFKLDSLQKSLLDNSRRRYTAEENIFEILKGNNTRSQIDLFEELIARVQANTEVTPIHIRQLEQFYDAIGLLLTNTLSNEVQKYCLRFLQVYFKSVEKLKFKKAASEVLAPNEILTNVCEELDSAINNVLVPYLVILSVSNKLQLKQLSIDLIYTYMKLTDNLSNLFTKFVKYGIENSDYSIAKSFMDPILCIMLTDEFKNKDLSLLVRSLVKQLSNAMFETSAIKCLNKIEHIVKSDSFNGYISRLPQNLRQIYTSYKKGNKNNNNNNEIMMIAEQMTLKQQNEQLLNSKNLKYNIIGANVISALSGEDEMQRLQAIKQLELTVKAIQDINIVSPFYQEFIVYMNNFVDDSNYEVRLCSLKILCIFIQKLQANVNQCYKVICSCARKVMSQTHQSKPIKQSLNTMLLLTIENMKNPILILDCLLDKIKDRSAKAREEFLNIIMGAILKYPSDKFEPLRKIFYHVVSLLYDIKRNVRHAALECISVIYFKLEQIDKNVDNLLDCLDNVNELQNMENLSVIKEVIMCRLNRKKVPTLNPDMSLEYAVKIPVMSSIYGISDLDIEWIVSATSSGSASNMSSARSHKSNVFGEVHTPNTGASSMHRMASFVDNNHIPINFKQRRIPSGNKRLPWDQAATTHEIDKSAQSINTHSNNTISVRSNGREVAPLKAFPLPTDDTLQDYAHASNAFSMNKSNYAQPSSYQEKYLKKLGVSADSSSNNGQNNNNTKSNSFQITKNLESNSQIVDKSNPNQETYDSARRQSEKYFSLDNLYNIDDNINSENNIQKRKLANLNNKNGIIPSRPIIPRRNSASKQHHQAEQQSADNSYLNTSRMTNNSQFDLEDTDLDHHEEFNSSMSSYRTSNKKYDTMPNLRTSAKNRKKLEKLFAITPNDSDSLVTNLSKQNKNVENNLYLSKLKAEKNNDMNTSRYTPSNPESGIFSMSDYDQIENPNRIYSQEQYQQNNKKQIQNKNNNNNNNNNNQSNVSTPSNSEYNPLAGVSFKATHGSDVEIVGVKLGNGAQENIIYSQQQQANGTTRKRASLQGLNDPTKTLNNSDHDDMLDIVGRGYNHGNESYGAGDRAIRPNDGYPFNQETLKPPEEIDYPMSLSFQSRLRQKTQEKMQEKMKKKDEKIRQREFDNLASNPSTPQTQERVSPPLPANKNFGLSISGYQNQSSSSVIGKPTMYNQMLSGTASQYDDYSERVAQTKTNNYEIDESKAYFNDSNLDNIENFLENRIYVPNNERTKFKPTAATQNRLRAKAAAAAAAVEVSTPDTEYKTKSFHSTKTSLNSSSRVSEINREEQNSGEYPVSATTVKEDFVKQPFKNAESAYKEAMSLINMDDWEKKCQAMNIIRRLSTYHEDITITNIHTIVLALVAEVNNLRSQVSRFGLLTFGDLFTNLRKNMDVDLDISVKTILKKNAETNDFIKSDVEKCLHKMTENVTTHKGLIALINGGGGHRNPSIRRTTAQFVYKMCELMGPGKILSGIKDVTEKILVTAAQFVVDGPVDIRWYGRRIFYMLMSHDEFDRLLIKHLNEKTRKDIKEILDTIRVKGPGDVPTESARNSRKSIRHNAEQMSRSAGNTNRPPSSLGGSASGGPPHPGSSSFKHASQSVPRLSQQSQEHMKSIGIQLRHTDFRERIDAIERFQVACETATELVIANLVHLFDKFNPSLADSNSKVNYKALNTMFQITPILADNLHPVIANVVPIIAQNLASKNSEIQDLASNILDIFIEFIDGSQLIQPFTNIALHGNTRIKPQLVHKLADLIPLTYSRKQKQVELHVLPAVWSLLNNIKGNIGNALTASVVKLVQNLYEQMGDNLIDKASASSSVPTRNLDLLKQLLNAPIR